MESGDGLAFQKKQIDLRCPITASQVAAFLESMCFYVELFYGVVISEIFKFMNCAISNNFTAQLRCALAFDHRMFTCDDEMSGNFAHRILKETGLCEELTLPLLCVIY
nr:hypothetical protein Iba_chr10eCG3130 [Ipomoea batatas]